MAELTRHRPFKAVEATLSIDLPQHIVEHRPWNDTPAIIIERSGCGFECIIQLEDNTLIVEFAERYGARRPVLDREIRLDRLVLQPRKRWYSPTFRQDAMSDQYAAVCTYCGHHTLVRAATIVRPKGDTPVNVCVQCESIIVVNPLGLKINLLRQHTRASCL